jgi:hypothetical protein
MLDPYLDAVLRRRKQFTVYSDTPNTDIETQLSTRNVTVRQRRLSPAGPPPFVAIRDDDGFVGALGLADLERLVTPPIVRPDDREGLAASYRAVLDVLEETVFSSLSRRQLLATSQEIEDRARRVGAGRLYVTFQSFSNLANQLKNYRRLGRETDLDIHVYGTPDWVPPAIRNVTYHLDEAGSLAEFWCVAFDGGPDPSQACVLIAREEGEGYVGFWSYDEALVGEILGTLDRAAGGGPAAD